jgi:hypothetical protein
MRKARTSEFARDSQSNDHDGAHIRNARKRPKYKTNESTAISAPLPASTQCEAGSMTALSLRRNVRRDRFQMHHYPLQARGPAYELAG